MIDTSMYPFIKTSEGRGMGDPMPVCWDGIWHIYALSLDMDLILHFTSEDLVNWTEHQPALVGKNIATGTVVRNDGNYYFFYTDSALQTIHMVTSSNPWEFDFNKSRLLLAPDDKTYKKGWFRDACVFFNENEKLWWILLEGRCPEVCTGLFKSSDLLTWTQCEPVFKDKAREYGSCPQIFSKDDIWYLALQDLGNCYYMAETPYGPWKGRGQYLSVVVEAASRFAVDGARLLTWGWLCDWTVKPEVVIKSGGGPLCVGREMVFKNDGTLGVQPLPELLAAIRIKLNIINLESARNLYGEWKIDAVKQLSECTGDGILIFNLPKQNPNYYFEVELEFPAPQANATIVVRASENADYGYGFNLNPANNMITIYDYNLTSDRVILNDKTYTFSDTGKASIQIFICDDYMEVFIDNQECLSARTENCDGYDLAIEAVGGPVQLKRPFLHYFENGDCVVVEKVCHSHKLNLSATYYSGIKNVI